MPFYDGIGVIAEKHAVVLDIGSAFTKVGYAGESSPRAIIRTPPNLERLDKDSLGDSLVEFVHKLYFEILLVNPKDRRVVLLESLLGDTRLKDELVKVLFNHFEVLSILFAPSHMMPLFGLGLQNGLVLDIGYNSASVIPVYQGVPMLRSWQALPLAGKAVHQRLQSEIDKTGTAKQGEMDFVKFDTLGVEIGEKTLEDIKIRLCFVTNDTRGSQIQEIKADASSVSGLSSFLKKSVPATDYIVCGDTVLKIDGQIREGVCEVLFERDEDKLNIPSMILDALLASPIDTRRDLASNIIIIGGTSMQLGFKARVFQEINKLMSEDHYSEKLKISQFKLHVPLGQANYASWAGASIFGATDAISTRSFTREQYSKEKAVPDWSNLRFNNVYNDERQG